MIECKIVVSFPLNVDQSHLIAKVYFNGQIFIESMDAPLVAPGERNLLNFDNALPDPGDGMHFCLCNNVWGTNFAMWFEDDMQFRFKLRFEG